MLVFEAFRGVGVYGVSGRCSNQPGGRANSQNIPKLYQFFTLWADRRVPHTRILGWQTFIWGCKWKGSDYDYDYEYSYYYHYHYHYYCYDYDYC